eukprot:1060003-Prymnesium_polylepis.1
MLWTSTSFFFVCVRPVLRTCVLSRNVRAEAIAMSALLRLWISGGESGGAARLVVFSAVAQRQKCSQAGPTQ